MGPTLSDADANQQLSLTDQLAIDVRRLELDLHWFDRASRSSATRRGPDQANPAARTSARSPTCWPSWAGGCARAAMQVVLLYLEDELGGAAGYDAAARRRIEDARTVAR